ncbi:hypothetical protein RRG08_046440 [Elysia crispata]|uniref:Uncharacterized protein n=1 Tax=Elysia crispata TaxID=231223 RepID=A0AAE0YIQ1_9GAST|nr:hypothetical protein RRG08_046440 [Elysia crispata]
MALCPTLHADGEVDIHPHVCCLVQSCANPSCMILYKAQGLAKPCEARTSVKAKAVWPENMAIVTCYRAYCELEQANSSYQSLKCFPFSAL